MNKLQWTKEAPNEEGVYWFRYDDEHEEPFCVNAERGYDNPSAFIFHEFGSEVPYSIDQYQGDFSGEWYGPIEPPMEDKDEMDA